MNESERICNSEVITDGEKTSVDEVSDTGTDIRDQSVFPACGKMHGAAEAGGDRTGLLRADHFTGMVSDQSCQ